MARSARTVAKAAVRGFASKAAAWTVLGVTTVGFAAWTPLAHAKEQEADLEEVKKMICQVIEDDPDMGPTLVRLAWHTSGTYDKTTGTGGSNGATMRFTPEADFGANAGLRLARNVLEPIKKAHPQISYADLWTYAGCVAIEEMDGPAITWRPGRVDKGPESCPPDGRLPDGEKGELMMLPTDMALIWDSDFRKYVEMYANDQDLWFADFAKAFQKLEELGCEIEKPWWKIF
eukprot:jgi/Pico_ML_1/52254/g2985.t2